MSRYNEFKNRKIKTVGELIEALKSYPKDATLTSDGGDIGGYDVTSAPYVDIKFDQVNKVVSFGHMEYEMYQAYEKNQLTYDQFKELNEEDDTEG